MKKRILAVPMLVLLVCLNACGRAEQNVIRLGTGDKGGGYYFFAKTLSALAEEGTFEILNTDGSADNIRRIAQGELDMAIVQNDTLHDAYNAQGCFQESGAVTNIGAVAALYTAACHIVVRADSDIRSIADLQGRTISTGKPESSTNKNAQQILSAAGLKETDVHVVHESFTDAAAALQEGRIDAFFCTALVGLKALTALDDSMEIHILGIDDVLAQRLMAQYDSYARITIPANSYNGQYTPVQTVGVKAVLVAGTGFSAEKVQQVVHLLFNNAQEIEGTCRLGNAVDVDFATRDVSIPFHDGTAEFYRNSGVQVRLDIPLDTDVYSVG